MGEVRYNQQRMSDAFDWIRNHSGRFASLTVERIRLFWFPDFGLGSAASPIWLITLLGFAGLTRCAVSNKLAAVLLGGLLLVYPLVTTRCSTSRATATRSSGSVPSSLPS